MVSISILQSGSPAYQPESLNGIIPTHPYPFFVLAVVFPDLASLALFLKAIKLRSLSRAAQESHLSLSAASRRIAQLEQQYGVPLLDRSPQGVSPTTAGKALERYAVDLLQQSASLHAEMTDYAQGSLGRVRLHANISAMSQHLPDHLARFSASFPRIKLQIHEARSQDIVHAVYKGSADIGVVTVTTPLEGLEYTLYDHDPLCAIVPADSPITQPSVRFKDLLPFDIVALDDTAAITQTQILAAAQENLPLKVRQQVQSFEAVCRLVAAGLGVAVLPLGAVQASLSTMAIRCIDIEDAWARRSNYLCIRTGTVSAPVQALYRYLKAATITTLHGTPEPSAKDGALKG